MNTYVEIGGEMNLMLIWFWTWVLVTIVLIVVCIISMSVVWKLMHPARRPVITSPATKQLTYESVQFYSRDKKVKLNGWFLPAIGVPTMTIIFAHGYKSNREQKSVSVLNLAEEMVKHGYNVLLFDFRNCGESGGNLTTIGLDEQQDLLGAIDWCKAYWDGPIGLIGYSMGAATSLLVAAQSDAVSGVVADSSFSDLHQYLLDNLSVWSKLPKYPFSPIMVWMIRYIMRKNPHLVRPISSIQYIYPRPVLFIHGDQDTAIPCINSEKMSKLYPDTCSFWKVTGADHIGSYRKNPKEYSERIFRFFDQLVERGA